MGADHRRSHVLVPQKLPLAKGRVRHDSVTGRAAYGLAPSSPCPVSRHNTRSARQVVRRPHRRPGPSPGAVHLPVRAARARRRRGRGVLWKCVFGTFEPSNVPKTHFDNVPVRPPCGGARYAWRQLLVRPEPQRHLRKRLMEQRHSQCLSPWGRKSWRRLGLAGRCCGPASASTVERTCSFVTAWAPRTEHAWSCQAGERNVSQVYVTHYEARLGRRRHPEISGGLGGSVDELRQGQRRSSRRSSSRRYASTARA